MNYFELALKKPTNPSCEGVCQDDQETSEHNALAKLAHTTC